MKQQILDIESMLSLANACLLEPKPDWEKVREHIDRARENLFRLAEEIEAAERE